jgi:valyl-tRNA synthetase
MTEETGHLWHVRYPLLEEDGKTPSGEWVTVATTRPETMLGDEAIAVHPEDGRYRHWIGRRCLLPLRDKTIPVIGDALVDPEFGTGCVKVTPAHDPADYEMALRHGLPFTVVIAPDGTMTAEAGDEFFGLDRMEARKAVVEELDAQKFLVKVEEYRHSVGYSERSHVPIEPYLSDQWFLRYPAVGRSKEAVERGEIRFHPDRWSKTYAHWMENLRDWCISRQLWWGHRIPVWYPKAGGEPHVSMEPPSDPENWEQDPDVLDTWFSSWLWPFATMGWPEKTPALAKFYPTTDLVTGPDIIFFWVARMIMAGFEFMGERPFDNVYFTGIIRDKLGRKMSKSLGNSPDPLDLIARYGADALRFGTMRSAPLGQDVLFDEKQVELGRNFCTKLWNAARFRQMQGGEVEGEIRPELLSGEDKWILLRLDRAVAEIGEAFAAYRFNEATQVLHRFFWNEFCDWYLEAAKSAFAAPPDDPAAAPRKANTLAVIDFILGHALRLFHPFIPFVTEELWHGLGYSADLPPDQGGETIMNARWPKPLGEDFRAHYGLSSADEEDAAARFEAIAMGRNLRGEFQVPSGKRVRFLLRPSRSVAPEELRVMASLLQAETLEPIGAGDPVPPGTPAALTPVGELLMPLGGLVDPAAERARLTKEIAKVDAELEKVARKLASESFVANAPAAVVEEHRERQEAWREKRERLAGMLAGLG